MRIEGSNRRLCLHRKTNLKLASGGFSCKVAPFTPADERTKKAPSRRGRTSSDGQDRLRHGHVSAGVPADVAEKMKALEREIRELRQANEILRKASAYFAMAELDRRSRP
jgi:hypothetical protein